MDCDEVMESEKLKIDFFLKNKKTGSGGFFKVQKNSESRIF